MPLPTTVVIAPTLARADSYSRQLADAEGKTNRRHIVIVSTLGRFVPNGVYPERVVWMAGWWSGRHADEVKRWAHTVTAKHPNVIHSGDVPPGIDSGNGLERLPPTPGGHQ